MPRPRIAAPLSLIACLLCVSVSAADAISSAGLSAYKPPLRGAPSGRFGGGTRGMTTAGGLQLCALAPDHVGWTSTPRPTFYWFSSGPATLHFSLTRLGDGHHLVRRQIAARVAGMHSIELTDLPAGLKEGQVYSWRIENADAKISLGGELRYVPADKELRDALRADPAHDAQIYAGSGRWYDAIAALSRQIEQSPNPASLHRLRSDWLEQVNLPIVSRYDRDRSAR